MNYDAHFWENAIRKIRTKSVFIFIIHQLLATLGVMISANLVAFFLFAALKPLNASLFADHNVHQLLTALPYFPVQIGLALWYGWSLERRFQHRSMLWVWIIPLVILFFAFVDLPTVSSLSVPLRLSHFFGWGCRPENRCVDQVVITMPFYSSAAYSTAAFLSRRMMNVLGEGFGRRKASHLIELLIL